MFVEQNFANYRLSSFCERVLQHMYKLLSQNIWMNDYCLKCEKMAALHRISSCFHLQLL